MNPSPGPNRHALPSRRLGYIYAPSYSLKRDVSCILNVLYIPISRRKFVQYALLVELDGLTGSADIGGNRGQGARSSGRGEGNGSGSRVFSDWSGAVRLRYWFRGDCRWVVSGSRAPDTGPLFSLSLVPPPFLFGSAVNQIQERLPHPPGSHTHHTSHANYSTDKRVDGIEHAEYRSSYSPGPNDECLAEESDGRRKWVKDCREDGQHQVERIEE